MKPVVTHPEAEAELEAAATYYEDRRSGLGQQFLDEFEAALSRLLENPQQYAIEINDIRHVRFIDSRTQSTTWSWRIGSGWLPSPTSIVVQATG